MRKLETQEEFLGFVIHQGSLGVFTLPFYSYIWYQKGMQTRGYNLIGIWAEAVPFCNKPWNTLSRPLNHEKPVKGPLSIRPNRPAYLVLTIHLSPHYEQHHPWEISTWMREKGGEDPLLPQKKTKPRHQASNAHMSGLTSVDFESEQSRTHSSGLQNSY